MITEGAGGKMAYKIKKTKLAVVSGGFDPIHEGHISMIISAQNSCPDVFDNVVVGLNSDEWLINKKGYYFMNWQERHSIVSNIKNVRRVIQFDDSDGTAINLLNKVKDIYPNHEIVFLNGGDRTKDNIPEMSVEDVTFEFGIGGEGKANSSSSIIDRFVKTLQID